MWRFSKTSLAKKRKKKQVIKKMKKKKQGMEIQGEDKYFLLLNKIPFAIIGLINVEVDRES